MEIDPEEFKRHYAELSDEGLLSIDRADLIELARTYYDAEVASRGLHPAELGTPVEEAGPEKDLVLAAKFLFVEEANLCPVRRAKNLRLVCLGPKSYRRRISLTAQAPA